jgi:hypothetical protein
MGLTIGRGSGFRRSKESFLLTSLALGQFFHGRLLRSQKTLLQNGAILRNAMRVLNGQITVRNNAQAGENTRKNSLLN